LQHQVVRIDPDACPSFNFRRFDMNRNTGIRMCLLAASSLAFIGLGGCDRPQTAETAGKKLDQRMEQIGQKTGKAIDDTQITAAVKAKIFAEPGLKVLKIDVDTKDGLVMLTGSADSAENVQRATQIASAVQGVKSVENRLAVSSKG
jgi:osmotically-inducible protein OsmY